MKFKVKALKQRGDASDAREEEPEQSEGSEAEESSAIQSLLEAANDLIPEKSAILSRMVNRRAEEKKRLSKMDASSPKQDMVESEVVSLAEDFEDVSRLHAELLSLSELVLAVAESASMGKEAKAKAVAMKAPDARTGEREDLAEKEEQLAKREEMVDRKIKGYVSKNKDLQDREAALSEKMKELEEQRASLEKMREEAAGSGAEQWEEREREVARRITVLQTVMSGVLGRTDSRENGTIDDSMSDLEASIKSLLDRNSASEDKLKEMRECEGEMKELLAVLDKLLGKLPEAAIEEFTSSEAYKLYEKVLDRYGI
jgi:hypothetical protein